MMNDNPEKSYIYCTPFLTEIERIKESANSNFYDPKNYSSTKIGDFNKLLLDGKNIAVTHTTFANSNDITIEYLSQGNYTLILDEVLDILIDYAAVTKEELTESDIALLFNEGFIKTDGYGKVYWLKASYPGAKYKNVERLSKAGNLFYLDNTMMVWQFPPQVFNSFQEIYVLTYLFQGSFLKPYFEYHNLQYELAGVDNKDEHYELIPYESDLASRAKYKQLITVYNDTKMNNYKASALCKSWYERQSKKQLKPLKDNLFNFFHNKTKAKSKDIMWTCHKKYMPQLKGKGYSIVRRLNKNEKELPTSEQKELEKKLNCYVPLNARATNDYRDRSVLAYCYNFFCNPYVKRYFENKNKHDGTRIQVDQDYLALSCLVQWVWRSRIRDDKPITIYIPSVRMRTLFINWLDGKM